MDVPPLLLLPPQFELLLNDPRMSVTISEVKREIVFTIVALLVVGVLRDAPIFPNVWEFRW